MRRGTSSSRPSRRHRSAASVRSASPRRGPSLPVVGRRKAGATPPRFSAPRSGRRTVRPPVTPFGVGPSIDESASAALARGGWRKSIPCWRRGSRRDSCPVAPGTVRRSLRGTPGSGYRARLSHRATASPRHRRSGSIVARGIRRISHSGTDHYCLVLSSELSSIPAIGSSLSNRGAPAAPPAAPADQPPAQKTSPPAARFRHLGLMNGSHVLPGGLAATISILNVFSMLYFPLHKGKRAGITRCMYSRHSELAEHRTQRDPGPHASQGFGRVADHRPAPTMNAAPRRGRTN